MAASGFLARRGSGMAVALGAAVGFALANTVVTAAYQGGSDPISVSGTRFFLPLLILVGYALLRKNPIVLPGREGTWALFIGVVTALYTLALMTALNRLPVGIAILVFYLFPILTVAISAAMGWTRLSPRTAGAAMVALAGLVFALGVRIDEYDLWGIGLAALAALGLAIVSAVSGRVIANSEFIADQIRTIYGAGNGEDATRLVTIPRGIDTSAVGALPTMMNAIVNALNPVGVEHVQMPATPERIWQAIQSAS